MENNSRKYVIVHLLKGESKVYHERLTKRLSLDYSIPNNSDKISPHITLKYFNQLLGEKELKELVICPLNNFKYT